MNEHARDPQKIAALILLREKGPLPQIRGAKGSKPYATIDGIHWRTFDALIREGLVDRIPGSAPAPCRYAISPLGVRKLESSRITFAARAWLADRGLS